MSFARPDLLPLTLIVPLLLALGIWLHARRRQRIARALSDPALLVRLGGGDLLRFPLLRLVLICAAGGLLAFSAAGPRWGQKSSEGQTLSLNIVLATDISKSMLAPDVEPSRLERARLFSRQLLRDLPGDRFGMVVFAGRAYVLSPLTVDHGALELYVDALDPAMVSQGGSSLAAAIAQATDLVRGSDQAGGDRAIVLLTDGEALEEANAVEDAANRAARAGVRIIAIGVGTPQGANIPEIDPRTGETIGMKRDEYGETVVSRLGEDLLRRVAEQTGGSYVRLDQAGSLGRVVSELRGMERVQGDTSRRAEPRERFMIFAALALLLLAADAVLHGPSLRAPATARVASTLKPRARAAIVLLALIGTNAFGIGDLERGNRLYRAGRVEEAVEVYRRALEKGDSSPQLQYNLGTALLALGRYDEAEPHFKAALAGVEPELRERTLYNLGNRFLSDARAQEDLKQQGTLLDAAAEAYRRALRIMPDDLDAKWNLEMALRARDENRQKQQSQAQQQQNDPEDSEDQQDQQDQQSQGGGGGSGQSSAGEGDRSGMGSMQERPMSQKEADRILSAIEQDERELTREKLRRGQRRVPVLRDW